MASKKLTFPPPPRFSTPLPPHSPAPAFCSPHSFSPSKLCLKRTLTHAMQAINQSINKQTNKQTNKHRREMKYLPTAKGRGSIGFQEVFPRSGPRFGLLGVISHNRKFFSTARCCTASAFKVQLVCAQVAVHRTLRDYRFQVVLGTTHVVANEYLTWGR